MSDGARTIWRSLKVAVSPRIWRGRVQPGAVWVQGLPTRMRHLRWRDVRRIGRKLTAAAWQVVRRIDIRKPVHAVMIGLIVAGIVAPIADVLATNERYKVTDAMKQVVERPSPTLMSKLRYDKARRASVFNAEGKAEAQADAKDQLRASLGAGGSKDTQLYTATLPDDPSQGVAVTDNVNGVTVKFVPQLGLLDGRSKDGRVVYPLKDQAGQMVFTPKANGVKEDIVLMHAPKDDAAEYHYRLDFPESVEARLEETGGIGFYTATPELFGNISYGSDKDRELVDKARKNSVKNYLMFKIPAPVVRETGKAGAVQARFILDDHDLTVRASGLKQGGYPLSIDPTFVLTSTTDFVLGSIDDNIDLSVADQVGRQTLVGGSTPGWTPNLAPNLAYAQFAASLVAYNGYLYIMGGGSGSTTCTGDPAHGATASTLANCTSGTTGNDVRYISLDPTTGALGTGTPDYWKQTSKLLTARQGLVGFGFNGYLYAIGGQSDSGVPLTTVNSVEYARINSDGSVGTWARTSNLNTVRNYPAGAIYQGVLYIMGGSSGTNNATPLNTIEWARLNGDGTVGSWTQSTSVATGNLTSTRSKARGGAYNGFVYITGGQNSTPASLSTVEYAPILSDGSLGAWVATTSFPTARRDHGMTISNGYLYVFGGCNSSTQACPGFIADTQYAVINADGTVGQWQSTVPYNTGGFNSRMPAGYTAYSNHLYFVGGCSTETATNNCGTQLVGTFITDIDPVGRFDRGVSTAASPPLTGTSTVARMGGRVAVLNGYLYYIGGCSVNNCTSLNSTVEYGLLNADGSLSNLSTTTVLPAGSGNNAGRLGHSVVAYDNKLYVVGGMERKTATTFPAPAAAPTTTTFGTTSTTHNTSMPGTVAAGDLLMCLFTNSGTGTVTATGWTALSGSVTQTNIRGTVLVKNAVGTEGGTTVNFATSATATAAAQVYRIPAGSWYGSLATVTDAVAVASVASGSTNAPNPPSLTPTWGSEDNLWFSYAGGANYPSVTTYPTNYTSGVHTTVATASVSSAQRGLTAATEDPAAFAMGGTVNGVAFTIAVRPNENLNYQYMNTILSNTQNSGGTLGASWSTESNTLPAARAFHTSELWHNYIYVLGGRDATSASGNVYYSQIGSGGALGSWSTSGTGIAARWGHSGGIWGNWIYVMGGQTDTSGTYIGTTAGANAIQKLTINTANGSISSATGYASNTTRQFAGGYVHNGFLYTFGGYLSSGTSAVVDISWAALDPSTGAPGTPVTTNIGNRGDLTAGLANARAFPGSASNGGYFYILGGCSSVMASVSFRGCTGFISTANTTELYLPNNGGTGQLATTTGTFITGSGNSMPDLPTVNAVAGRSDHTTVAYNGFLYVIGGCNAYTSGACTTGGTAAMTDVSAATIGVNGTLGTWTQTGMTALPSGRSSLQAAAYNGYLYVVGGRPSAGGASNTVWVAPIGSTGTIGTWVDSSSNYLPGGTDRISFGLAISNGYIYAVGGDNGSGTKKSDVYYAALNSDGSLAAPGAGCGGNTWCSTTAFTTARSGQNVIAYNGKLYVIGGTDGTNALKDIQFATINSADGSVGSWTNTTDVPRGMNSRQAVAANGYMYFVGNEGDATQVTYVNINADGTLGMVQDSVAVLSGAHAHGAISWADGVVYVTGGCVLSGSTCGSTIVATSEKAGQQAISRTGHYSKLFDTQVDTSPTQLVINGAINGPGAAVEMKFQSASQADPVLGVAQLIRPVTFGQFYNVQALNSSGSNVGVAKLYLYVLTLDDSRSGTFPDIPNLSGSPFAQTAVTDITLYYHANPGRRLRHGASFTNTDCNPAIITGTPGAGCLLDTAP